MPPSPQQLADWLEEYFGPNPSDAACEPVERQKEQWLFLGTRLHEFVNADQTPPQPAESPVEVHPGDDVVES